MARTGLVAWARRCRPDRRTVVLGAAGAVAGALCGLLGVAGGVVIVPVLTSPRVGMARAAASGTTIAAVLPISVVAAVTYAGLHNVDGRAAAAIVGWCGALTVPLGAEIAAHTGALPLRVTFAVFLIATVAWGLVHRPSQQPPGPARRRAVPEAGRHRRPLGRSASRPSSPTVPGRTASTAAPCAVSDKPAGVRVP